MTVNFFVQARLGSTRFPGKCLETVAGDTTLLESIDRRIRRSRYCGGENVLYLTSESPTDDPLAAFFDSKGWGSLRGSESDVFSRFRAACERNRPDMFVRICGDNPLLDPGVMDRLIEFALDRHPDYASFRTPDDTPVILTHYGFFAEVVSTRAFLSIDPAEIGPLAREHVTPPFYAGDGAFESAWLAMPEGLVDPGIRLTVDTPGDLEVVRTVFARGGIDVTIEEAYRIARAEPEIMSQMRTSIESNEKA